MEERRFALVIGSCLLLVGRDNTCSSIAVVCAQWEADEDRFLSPKKWFIESSGLEIVAAESVSTYDSGILQPYVLLCNSSVMKLGRIDLTEGGFLLVADVHLPPDFSPGNSSYKTEFLLSHGPCVTALIQQKMLVLHPDPFVGCMPNDVPASDALLPIYTELEYTWRSYIVSLDELNNADGKLLLIAEQNNDCNLGVILGIKNGCLNVSSPRMVGWQYIKLDLSFFGRQLEGIKRRNPIHSVVHSCARIYEESYSLMYNGLFPSNLDPLVISCVLLVPAEPSFLNSMIVGFDAQQEKHSHDLIIATYDKKVLKCRRGHIVAEVNLTDFALNLSFAVLAGGQGVLVAQLSGVKKSVVVLCSETLEELKVWSNIVHVAVGDLQLVGHDQILLLKVPLSSQSTVHSLESLMEAMYITDLRRFGFVGLLGQNEDMIYSGECGALEKSHHIQSIVKCLQARIDSGKLQEKYLKAVMEKKKDLVKSSCTLFEEMRKQSIMASIKECSFLMNDFFRIMENMQVTFCKIKQLYHGLQCGKWLILIGIEIQIPRGVVLDGATVMLTTIQGQIEECASSAKRIDISDKVFWCVIKVPLERFAVFSCLPSLNIFLKAQITHKGLHLKLDNNNVDKEHIYLYTEWLGRVCIRADDLVHNFSVKGLPCILAVGENRFFVFKPRELNFLLNLPYELRSVLHMDFCEREINDSVVLERSRYKFVTVGSFPLGYAYVNIFQDVALVTLCAEDAEYLLRTEALLVSHFQNQYNICYSATFEDMLGATMSFSRRLLQDFGLETLTCESAHSLCDGERIGNYDNDADLSVDQCLCCLIPL